MRIIKKKDGRQILTTNLPKETKASTLITTGDFETIKGKLKLSKKAKKRLGIKEEKNADKS